jgi:DNA gyrase subunit B
VQISLVDEAAARTSADALQQALHDPADPHGVRVEAQYDETEEAWRLAVIRPHFGNLRVSTFDRHFVRGGDYAVLSRTAKTFLGLMGEGAIVRRGTGDKQKEKSVSDFREVMQWLRAEAERSISKQRYKGLGEMNPEQLWETTMDPTVRRLLRVQIEDAIAADEIFVTLMGDNVEPRRAFIETHALQAGNIDV